MRLSLATKMFLGYTLLILMFGVVSVYVLGRFSAERAQLNQLNRQLLPLDRLAAEIEALSDASVRGLTDILRADPATRLTLLQSGRRSFQRSMQLRIRQAQGILGRSDTASLPDKQRRFLDEVGTRLEQIREQSEALDRTLAEIEKRWLEPESFEPPPGPEAEIEPAGRRLLRDVRLMKLALKNRITAQVLDLEQQEGTATAVVLWLSLLSVAVGALIVLLSFLALRPVQRLSEAARRISQGDFSASVPTGARDEIGFLATEFNRMARALEAREAESRRQQEQLALVNRQLKQSSLDLELLKLYNENIIRSIHHGILVCDVRGFVTTLNPAAETLFGLQPATAVGKPLSELPLAGTCAELLRNWSRVLNEKAGLFFEALTLPGPGERLVDLRAAPLFGADGNAQGVLILGEEVTEKVRTKQALIQSERLAAIGRMSAMVAHEIRNPLSAIGLNAELLEEELLRLERGVGDEPRKLLASISGEVERLTQVTDEYLRFARLPKPHLAPEDLNAIVRDLLRFLGPEMTRAKVEVHLELDAATPPLPLDESQVRQALINLIKNSVQSMPEGGTLRIRTDRSDGTVRLRIQDSGRGMDAACLERIFDPFFSTRDGGTGLGLTLTQQIVLEHGGRIRCESAPGQGTCFVVEFPSPGPAAG
ncbi:MAG: PAS domain-containing protein [Myxococcales bacterium]|nr:PAS domain-containing protein [Myxococcales bacterium]